MHKFLDAYLRTLSRRLTWQVKRALHSSQKTLPKSKRGALIRRILEAHNASPKTLDAKGWERVRKDWRDKTKELLTGDFGVIDVATLATRAIQEGQVGLTPERVVQLLFNFRPRRLQLEMGDLAEFKAYLVSRAITELESRRILLLKPNLTPILQHVLTALLVEPRAWLKLPHIQKRTIPFWSDDGRVYLDRELQNLYILARLQQGATIDELAHFLLRKQKIKREAYAARVQEKREYIEAVIYYDRQTDWFEKVKKRKEPIHFTIQLEKGNPIECELKTPKRFLKLVLAGYAPQKATLLQKQDGGLTLALPFEKVVPKSQCLGRSDLSQIQDPLIKAGLDLGLKTFAVLSMGKGDKTVPGAWGEIGEEIARYFIDPKELYENRTEWLKPLNGKAAPLDYKHEKIPNFKRRLANLRGEARRCQSERDDFRNECRKQGINHRHKREFWRLNSELKRIWRHVSALHDELTRQIATRVLAACEYNRVHILRMEDLRWSKHSKKYKVGYFLASHQIHWFFGQIQTRIADLAPSKGIFVEWVKAKHTSNRCSKCGHIGKTKAERKRARQGKIFKCTNPKCKFQLDADLNAARNIRVAPLSKNIPPSLYALGGGSPYNLPADTSVLA